MVRAAQQSRIQTDVSPILQRACQQFSEALHKVSFDAIKRSLNTLRTVTPTQLRHKSASNSIQRSQITFTGPNSSQP